MQIVIACCIVKGNSILMVKEAKKQVYGLWNLPSGKLEPLEDIFAGAKREAKEETGYDIELTGLLTVQNFMRIEKPTLRIVFRADIIGGAQNFDDLEILEVQWIQINQLPIMQNLRNKKSIMDVMDCLNKECSYPIDIIKNIV